MFTTTPDTITELRLVLQNYLVGADGDLIDKVEIQEAVESVPGLAFELFKMMKGKLGGSAMKPQASITSPRLSDRFVRHQ